MRTILSLLLLLTIDTAVASAQFRIRVFERDQNGNKTTLPVAAPRIESALVSEIGSERPRPLRDEELQDFICNNGDCTTNRSLGRNVVELILRVGAIGFEPGTFEFCYNDIKDSVVEVYLRRQPFGRFGPEYARCRPTGQVETCCRVPTPCPTSCSPTCQPAVPQTCFADPATIGGSGSLGTKQAFQSPTRRSIASINCAWVPVPAGDRRPSTRTSSSNRLRGPVDRSRL